MVCSWEGMSVWEYNSGESNLEVLGFLKDELRVPWKKEVQLEKAVFSNASFDIGDRALVLSGCIVLSYAFTKHVSVEKLGNNPGWIDDVVLATAGIVVCSWHEKGNIVIL